MSLLRSVKGPEKAASLGLDQSVGHSAGLDSWQRRNVELGMAGHHVISNRRGYVASAIIGCSAFNLGLDL